MQLKNKDLELKQEQLEKQQQQSTELEMCVSVLEEDKAALDAELKQLKSAQHNLEEKVSWATFQAEC